ncbi:hypothetical protein ACSTJQ_12880 [Vibrio parahaemolyticus]
MLDCKKENDNNESLISDLSDALNVASDFIDNYDGNDKSSRFWSVFAALYELISSSSSFESKMYSECYVTTEELKNKIVESGYYKTVEEFSTSRLSQEFKRLIQRMEIVAPMFLESAKKLGVSVIPIVEKTNNLGGKGNQSEYRIIPKKISKQIEKLRVNDDADINYYLESEKELPRFFRFFNSAIGAKIPILFLGLGISPFITFFISTIIYNLSLYDFTFKGDMYIFIACILWTISFLFFFRFIPIATYYNIAMLPDWMLPLSLRTAVLHIELNKDKSKFKKHFYKIKVFSAKCPICDCKVHLTKKNMLLNSRLIGECVNNPLEHKFSFDYTTMSGYKLFK